MLRCVAARRTRQPSQTRKGCPICQHGNRARAGLGRQLGHRDIHRMVTFPRLPTDRHEVAPFDQPDHSKGSIQGGAGTGGGGCDAQRPAAALGPGRRWRWVRATCGAAACCGVWTEPPARASAHCAAALHSLETGDLETWSERIHPSCQGRTAPGRSARSSFGAWEFREGTPLPASYFFPLLSPRIRPSSSKPAVSPRSSLDIRTTRQPASALSWNSTSDSTTRPAIPSVRTR